MQGPVCENCIMNPKQQPGPKPRNPVAKFAGKLNKGGRHKNAMREVAVPRLRKHVRADNEPA